MVSGGERTGTVFWITGLARVGKTTTAHALAAAIATQRSRPVILDGDAMRAVLDVDHYDLGTRRRLGFIYARLAREISSQGLDVIVATISLFNDVHRWNRSNMPDYCEVLLEASMDALSARVGGNIYTNPDEQHLVGRDISVEWPFSPDLRIRTDDGETPESIAFLILRTCTVFDAP